MIPRRRNQSGRRSFAKNLEGSIRVLQNFAMKAEAVNRSVAEDFIRTPALVKICVGLGVTSPDVSALKGILKAYNLSDLEALLHLVMSGKITWSEGKLHLKGFK